jgi:hypothetical protein
MKRLLPCLCLFLLAACQQGSSGVKGATGETPVRYVICGAAESNCFVAARFKSLDSCQRHKNWSDMLCDSESKPGEMVCRRDTGPSIASSYCAV